jgi:hypothetical protein
MSATRRPVRDVIRAWGENNAHRLEGALEEALQATTIRHHECPKCGLRSPVRYPDVRALTQLLQVMADQGYGRAAQVEPSRDTSKIAAEDLTPEEMMEELARLKGPAPSTRVHTLRARDESST